MNITADITLPGTGKKYGVTVPTDKLRKALPHDWLSASTPLPECVAPEDDTQFRAAMAAMHFVTWMDSPRRAAPHLMQPAAVSAIVDDVLAYYEPHRSLDDFAEDVAFHLESVVDHIEPALIEFRNYVIEDGIAPQSLFKIDSDFRPRVPREVGVGMRGGIARSYSIIACMYTDVLRENTVRHIAGYTLMRRAGYSSEEIAAAVAAKILTYWHGTSKA